MDNTDIKQELVLNGILTQDDTIYLRFKRLLNDKPDLLQEIMWHTSFLEYEAEIKTRLHCILKNITEQPKCAVCDKILKMRMDGKYRYTFSETCGSKCFSGLDRVKNKRKATNLKTYGTTNYLASERGKQQTQNSLMDRYGVTNASFVPGAMEKRQATIIKKYGSIEQFNKSAEITRDNTMLERYGAKHIMDIQLFKERQQQSCLNKHGVTNVWLLESTQRKRFATMQRKYGVNYALQHEELKNKQHCTMRQRYGVDHALQNTESIARLRNTMQRRYGVDHALQHKDIKRKALKQSKLAMVNLYGRHYQQSLMSDNSYYRLHDVDWLITQHHESNNTLSHIAQLLNVAHSTVGLHFKKLNIPVLSISGSQPERDIASLIGAYTTNIDTNTRNIISPFELDIYDSEKSIAIEYNGTYWHGESRGKGKTYHINKTNRCTELGIRLIHITDTEWLLQRPIVESRIATLFGQSERIHARTCKIIELQNMERRTFLNTNHIQGDCVSSTQYGLMHNNNIVAVMTFGVPRYSKSHQYELLRYANVLGHTVVGGASKLFKHFIKECNPQSIITYSDKRWNTGNLYLKLGFLFSHTSTPNYRYFKPSNCLITHSRHKFQKHKLKNILQTFDPSLTEWQNMVNNGYDRIWDCGNDVYNWVM